MAAVINTVIGTGQRGYSGDNGPGLEATMDNPFHLALDPSENNLYFADCFNFAVRKINLSTGILTNFAGNGVQGHSGDGGAAVKSNIDEIYAIQVDQNGDVYICQRFNPSIRKISSTTDFKRVAGDKLSAAGEYQK